MARSIVNQGLYLQKEVTPGTPITTAMKRYLGLKGTVGWEVEKEYFRASGYKTITGENVLTEMGTMDLELIQDYNAFLPLLAGVFGAPVTTPLTATPTPAYEHVFTLNPKAADTLVSHTAMWGDSARALQLSYVVFHALTIGIGRTELSLDGSAIVRKPETGIALPTTGVTEVPMVPVRSSTYNVYLDESWANLGTTQLLQLYNTEIDFGEKYAADWVVNRNLPSFSELLEQDEIDYTQSLTVGFDATAQGLVDTALDGDMKFVRVECIGPDINGTDNYGLTIDTAVRLNPTDVGESDAGAVVVNFDGTLQTDGVSGNVVRATLINGLASL